MKTDKKTKRILTKREIRILRGYQLPENVERMVYNDWTRNTSTPNTKIKTHKGILSYLSTLLMFLLPIILWLWYIDPDHTYLLSFLKTEKSIYITELIVIIGIVMLWFGIFLQIMAAIAYTTIRKIMHRNWWHPNHLALWKQDVIYKQIYSIVWVSATVVGCIIHGYYVVGILYCSTYIWMALEQWAAKRLIRTHIMLCSKNMSTV